LINYFADIGWPDPFPNEKKAKNYREEDIDEDDYIHPPN